MNNVKNYIIRRSGQLIGTYTDKDQAFSDKLPCDNVFEIVETHGEYGCMKEHKIDN